MSEVNRLAVVIDADNASFRVIKEILAEIAKLGVANVKRAYGDWTGGLKGWKNQLNEYAILPVQVFAYTTGKNSTDSALIIDAMDLLYTGSFDGFCIVSSDSDYTRLATRLRESGMVVYGFGEFKTPKPLVNACNKFIYIENLSARGGAVNKEDAADSSPEDISGVKAAVKTAPKKPKDVAGTLLEIDSIIGPLKAAVEASSFDDGWANLATIGHYIVKTNPEFDARSYGFSKMSEMVRSLDVFDVKEEGEGPAKIVYVRVVS